MTRKRSRRRPSRSTGSERGRGAGATPLETAARILRAAPRTEAELHARLVARGYGAATAAAVVGRCRELGWVSDARFAGERARHLRTRGAGSLRIAADLAARGLAEDLVEAAVAESLEGEPEAAWAARVLERFPQRHGPAAWRLLASRGFPEDVITGVLGWPAE